jgi:hypothetical protein
MKNQFTPLESPLLALYTMRCRACSRDGDVFGANAGFRAPCEPSRWKADIIQE